MRLVLVMLGCFLAYRLGRCVEKALASNSKQEELFSAYQEVIPLVTEGQVRLISSDQYAAEYGDEQPLLSLPVTTKADVRRVRKAVDQFCHQKFAAWREVRHPILLALNEAVTNVVKHTPGGKVLVFLAESGPRFHVQDFGAGIALDELPHMLFMKGFSTTTSLGAGFTIMRHYLHQIEICISHEGTTLILHSDLKRLSSKLEPSTEHGKGEGNHAVSCCG